MTKIYKKASLLLLAFILSMALFSVKAYANDLWNNGVYHFTDASGIFDEDEARTLMKEVHELIPEKQFDFNCIVVPDENLGGYDLDYFADYLYKENNSGYGVNKDGIILIINTSNEKFILKTYGRGKEVFTKRKLENLTLAFRAAYSTEDYPGVVRTFYEMAPAILDEANVPYSNEVLPENPSFVFEEQLLISDEKPIWYVSNPDNFVDFHDQEAPKLVDDADILTDEEEDALIPVIEEIVERTGKDLVVFTDTSTYGLDRSVYAADFYVYNGYGIDDEFSGAVFFVCMNPDDRGFYTAATGKAQSLWSALNSDITDNLVLPYFQEGNYYDGISKWIECMDNIYSYGSPTAPSWYKDYKNGVKRDKKADLFNDSLGTISDEDKTEISAKLQELSDLYDIDIAVLYDSHAIDMDPEEYVKSYYDYTGYSDNCILLTCLDGEDYDYKIKVYSYGDISSKFTDKVYKQLEDKVLFNLSSNGYGNNTLKYLDTLEYFLSKGRMPLGFFKKLIFSVICLIFGLIVSMLLTKRAVKTMEEVQIATGAAGHLVKGSLQIISHGDHYLKTREECHYSPESKDDDNNRSSGGGGSSHSSSYSSSSGRSFSGSGKSF